MASSAAERIAMLAHSDIFSFSISPLPGKLCEQFIRCGKAGCRCQEGERHGPYYYRIWREGSRVQKVYVKREELESVQAACDSYKDYQAGLRQLREMRRHLTRRVSHECRRAQSLMR